MVMKKHKKIKRLTNICSKFNLYLPNYKLLNTTLFTRSFKEKCTFILWNLLYVTIVYKLVYYRPIYQFIDIMCIFSSICFYSIFFGLFLSGKVKAFYRNDYDTFLKCFISFISLFVNGSFIRLLIVYLYNNRLVFSFNTKTFLVILILNLIFYWVLFYTDKNVSFEDFSTLSILNAKILTTTDLFIIEEDSYDTLYQTKEDEKNQKKIKKSKKDKRVNVNNFKYSLKKEKEFLRKYTDTYTNPYPESDIETYLSLKTSLNKDTITKTENTIQTCFNKKEVVKNKNTNQKQTNNKVISLQERKKQ